VETDIYSCLGETFKKGDFGDWVWTVAEGPWKYPKNTVSA